MEKPSRRHHYLPQFYLRRFCNADGLVLRTFRGPDDRLYEKPFAPKATGYEEDLYAIANAGKAFHAARSDVIERDVFGPIDNNGAIAFDRLISTAPSQLSGQEKEYCAVFVNSLLERHPQRMRDRDQIAERLARERFEAVKKLFGPPLPGRADVFSLIDPEQLGRNIHREHMVRELSKPETIAYLTGLTMLKFRLNPGSAISFVTGDNPVLVNGGRPWPVRFFTLALAPDTLLVGHGVDGQLDESTMLGLVLLHNLELFRQCEYVFSREPLTDSAYVKTRFAAQQHLKPIAWQRS